MTEDAAPLSADAEELRRWLLDRARFAEGGAFDREVVTRLRAIGAATPTDAAPSMLTHADHAGSPEPVLDVERLAAAICNAEAARVPGSPRYDRFMEEAKDLFRKEAVVLAREYAALSDPIP